MERRDFVRVLLVYVAGGLFAAWFCLRMSTHGFSGYDVSPMIDAGWRVYSGQVPGRDFVVTIPPSLYVAADLAYRWFGVNWPALGKAAVVVYGAMLLLGARVLLLGVRTAERARALPLVAAYGAAQSLLPLSVTYLWHASMTQQFGMYAVAAAWALLRVPVLAGWRRVEALLHLGLAGGLLVLSKPNVAWPALLLCVGLLARQRRWREVAGVLGMALLLAAGVLLWVHVSLWGMVGAYVGLDRWLPLGFLVGTATLYARYGLGTLLTMAILAPALTAAWLLWRRRPAWRARPVVLLGFGAVALGLLGMSTNYDYKLTDAPLCVLGLALLCSEGPPLRQVSLPFRTRWATRALVFTAVFYGATRFREQSVGTWADDKCRPRVNFVDPFLGHENAACGQLEDLLHGTDAVLAEYPGQRVFFGPSMEFLYAGRRLQSPQGLPNWWHIGSSFARRRSAAIVRAWEAGDFGVVIFDATNEDRVQMAHGISEAIDAGYERVPSAPELHVYVRRKAGGGQR